MKKYGKSYENIGDSITPIFRGENQNIPAKEGEINKYNRGYVNIGSTEKPVLQLAECSYSESASADIQIKSFFNSDDETITYTLEGSGNQYIDYWTINTTTFVSTWRSRFYDLVGVWRNLHVDTNLVPYIPDEWSRYDNRRYERHYQITNLDEISASSDLYWDVHGKFVLWGETGPELSYAEAIAEMENYTFPSEYDVEAVVEGIQVTLPIYEPSSSGRNPYNLEVKAYTAEGELLSSAKSTTSRILYNITIDDLRRWYPSCPSPSERRIQLYALEFKGTDTLLDATFFGYVHSDGKYSWASGTHLIENGVTNESGWFYGHTVVTMGQSKAWTIIPDGEHNKTSTFLGFAQGWDGTDYNYHIVSLSLEYANLIGNADDWILEEPPGFRPAYYRLSGSEPPMGWIGDGVATTGSGHKTYQKDCRIQTGGGTGQVIITTK